MKGRRLLSMVLAGVLAFSPSFAGITDQAIMELDAPKVVEGRDMTTLSGGGVRFRIKDETFRPFNIIPPNLRTGCGGIDATFGAFSYFNMEYLGQFLQNVLQAAPVIAFNLALHTLCPQCEQLLQQLTSIANQINQIGASKCAAIQFATSVGKHLINEAMGWKESAYGQVAPDQFGILDKWLKTPIDFLNQYVSGPLQQLCPQGNCIAGLMFKLASQNGNVSLVEYTVDNEIPYAVKSLLGVDNETLKLIIRAYMGDVVIRGADQDKNRSSTVYYREPREGDPAHMLELLTGASIQYGSGGATLDTGSCFSDYTTTINTARFNGCTDNGCFEDLTQQISMQGLCYKVKEEFVKSIIQKAVSRQPLSDQEKLIMASMPAPLMGLYNIGTVEPSLLDVVGDKMARYMAAQLGVSIVDAITRSLQKWGGACLSEKVISDADKKSCEKFLNNVAEARRAAVRGGDEAMKDLYQSVANINKSLELQARVMARVAQSPLYGPLGFSKLVGAMR